MLMVVNSFEYWVDCVFGCRNAQPSCDSRLHEPFVVLGWASLLRCPCEPSLARWRKKRLCQETWKQRHRGAYLAQKRELAHRPEYLAKRRALYAQKRAAKRPNMGDSA